MRNRLGSAIVKYTAPDGTVLPKAEGENYDLFEQQAKKISFTPVARRDIKDVPAKQRVRMVTTGHIKAAGLMVRDVDAASALLPRIRKSAQENAYFVTTDRFKTFEEATHLD